MPEAARRVIIDHADGLHVRIADRRTDKAKSSAFEVFAHLHTAFERGFALPGSEWLAIHELPDVICKTAIFLFDR